MLNRSMSSSKDDKDSDWSDGSSSSFSLIEAEGLEDDSIIIDADTFIEAPVIVEWPNNTSQQNYPDERPPATEDPSNNHDEMAPEDEKISPSSSSLKILVQENVHLRQELQSYQAQLDALQSMVHGLLLTVHMMAELGAAAAAAPMAPVQTYGRARQMPEEPKYDVENWILHQLWTNGMFQPHSLSSVSPSIKSLPRELQLMDDDDEDDDDDVSDGDEVTDDDDDGVSAAALAPKRKSSPPPAAFFSDEDEDDDDDTASTDTLFVADKQIFDPYGEKGIYSGALSKSTGTPNGKGRMEYYEKEGRWYEGDWIHGRWSGYGRMSNGDGDLYEGELDNDHKHGTGVMKFADGRIFEGKYIRGEMIQGTMTYPDGSVYEGSWVDGMRHGRGKCIFVDGSEYEGEFREGNFHGHGQMTWPDGGWYVGEWCEDQMHGQGKEIRPDGSLRHDGEWSHGQPIRSRSRW